MQTHTHTHIYIYIYIYTHIDTHICVFCHVVIMIVSIATIILAILADPILTTVRLRFVCCILKRLPHALESYGNFWSLLQYIIAY